MLALKNHLQSHEDTSFYELRKSLEISNFCEAIVAKYDEEMKYIADVFESNPDAVSALHKVSWNA